MTTWQAAGQSASERLAPGEIRRIIFGLMMAMLLSALDQTIVATALPTIGRDLGDVEHLPWVVTAYLLAATSAVPIYGKLADIHGRRVMLLASIAIFLVGSVLCALAPTMPILVAARAIQGIGGGGLLALSQTIVGDMLAPRERASYQAYFAAAFAAASLAGPVLGGFFAQHLSWTMIFWINVPLGLAAYAMTSAPLRRLPRHERRHRLDVIGAVLLIASTSMLLVTISWAAARYGWLGLPTIGLFILTGALLLMFGYRLRHTGEPLIPLEVLGNQVVRTATLAATLSVGLFLGLAIYAPILFETVRGLSASESGLAMLPLTIGTVGGAMIAGRAMARLDHYKRVPMAALPFAAVAAVGLLFGAGTVPIWVVSSLLAVISIALGTLLPVSTVSIQNAVALHQLGTATATANLCRQLGGAVTVAIFGTIIVGSGGHGSLDAAMPASADLLSAIRTIFALAACGSIAAFATIVIMEEKALAGGREQNSESPLVAASD